MVRYHNLLPKWLKFKRLPISSVGEETEQLEWLDTADRNVKWCNHLEKRSGSFFIKLNIHLTIRPSISTFWYLLERNGNIRSPKGLCLNIHSSSIREPQTRSNLKCLTRSELIHKLCHIHVMEYNPAIRENGSLTHVTR